MAIGSGHGWCSRLPWISKTHTTSTIEQIRMRSPAGIVCFDGCPCEVCGVACCGEHAFDGVEDGSVVGEGFGRQVVAGEVQVPQGCECLRAGPEHRADREHGTFGK